MPPKTPIDPADAKGREQLHRLETLLQQVEKFKDAEARALTKEIVQSLMDFHGAALEKILDHIATAPVAGIALIDSLAKNDLIASALLLYGLHPIDLETRIGQALEKARPYLLSHGGNVQLLSLEDGVVRLRLQGSCHGCPSSAITLRQTIEQAIMDLAPDITAIDVEEVTQEQPLVQVGGAGRVALPILS